MEFFVLHFCLFFIFFQLTLKASTTVGFGFDSMPISKLGILSTWSSVLSFFWDSEDSDTFIDKNEPLNMYSYNFLDISFSLGKNSSGRKDATLTIFFIWFFSYLPDGNYIFASFTIIRTLEMLFILKESNEKNLVGVASLPSTFPPPWNKSAILLYILGGRG